MDDRILRYPELDIIFYEKCNQAQLEHMINIIKVLGQYILLDTAMLMQAYQDRYKEPMGLSYLKRAVKEKLIIEYSEKPDSVDEAVRHYYVLKPTIHQYLNQNNIATNKLHFTSAHAEKSRLLTFNAFAFQNRISPEIGNHQDDKARFFLCDNDRICHFSDWVDDIYIRTWLNERKVEQEYEYMPITTPLESVGKGARAVIPNRGD